MKASNWPLLKEKAWTDCLQFSLPASFSVFWLRAMIVFSVYFSFYDRVEFSVFFSLFNYSHLPHGYKKHNSSFPQVVFSSLFSPRNANTAASVERRTKLNAAFSTVFVRPFFFLFFFAHQRKSLRKSVLLHMNLQTLWRNDLSYFTHSLRQNIYRENERGWGQREKRCWGLSGLDPVLSGLQWAVSSLCDSSTGLCLARKRLAGWQAVAEP